MDASVRPFPESRLCSPFGRSARQTSGRYHRSHSKMTGRTIRLAIQSSRRLMREALGTYLASGPGFAVVGQTASLESLITLCALRRPEVALVEIDSLTGEAVEALCHFRATCPGTEAVVAYARPTPHALDTALRSGITALVPSSQGIDAVVRMLRQRAGPVIRQHRNGTALTDREMEIISLMGSGYGVPEMADLLDISRRTVENHKRRIYSKLHVGNQSHAVSRATVLGLLDAPTHDPSRLPSLAVGEAPLVVVRGPDGPCRDQVVLALVACGQPFALAETAPMTGDKDWPRWQRDALVNVLIDPTPEDWALASTLGGPVLGPVPGRSRVLRVQRGRHRRPGRLAQRRPGRQRRGPARPRAAGADRAGARHPHLHCQRPYHPADRAAARDRLQDGREHPGPPVPQAGRAQPVRRAAHGVPARAGRPRRLGGQPALRRAEPPGAMSRPP